MQEKPINYAILSGILAAKLQGMAWEMRKDVSPEIMRLLEMKCKEALEDAKKQEKEYSK